MRVDGTIYGVALNDRMERDALAGRFMEKPYGAPPIAPVLYVKPRACVAADGRVLLPAGAEAVLVQATVAVRLARAATQIAPEKALATIGAMALAIDVTLPGADHYRPAIAEKCRDTFLPLGAEAAGRPDLAALEVETLIDGAPAHGWSLARLYRNAATLIADLSSFMTLEAGDVLLLGIAGDAPTAPLGARIEVRAAGFPPLVATMGREDAA